MSDYLDTGDRVIVKAHIAEPEHMRTPQPDKIGHSGTIVANDGWGLCTVELDEGGTIRAWNGADLAPMPPALDEGSYV